MVYPIKNKNIVNPNIDKLPLVYAVVLNFNGFDDSERCICSLKESIYPNLKIVIVDNLSNDLSGVKLKDTFPELPVIFTNKNMGYAGGMNLGAKFALKNNADLILLTNNDVVFTKNFLQPLLATISTKEKIGIVSPKILYLNDKKTIYSAGADFKVFLGGAYNPYRGKPAHKFGNQLREITFADGSCLLVKKDVFWKVGYLDEKYFMYFEDLDFSEKVRKYFKIYFVPDSIVYHKTGAGSNWSNYSSLYYYFYTRNRLIFFSNHNFLIKVYGIIFTLFNTCAKSLVLIKGYFFNRSDRLVIKNSVISIWKGTFSGLKIILNLSKVEDNKLKN